MDLFERYLQAVRKFLPWQRQDDIIAELRANLDAQREEREAELGRPLTEGEMIDWLKELGPPMQMASRYQAPRYLIGPTLFPMYTNILRLVLIWASVAYTISIAVRMIVESHGTDWLANQVINWPGILITVAAWVTAAFAALEFISERYPDKCPDFLAAGPHWSPTSLPPLEKDRPRRPGKPRNLVTAIAEFVVEVAVMAWLLLIPTHPYLLLGPGAAYLRHSPVALTPIWWAFYWAIIAFNAVQLGWHGYNLLTDNWRSPAVAEKLVIKALGIVPIAVLLAAPGRIYLTLSSDQSVHLPTGFDIPTINHAIFTGAAIIAVITCIQFAWDAWKAVHPEASRQFRAVL